MKALNKIAEMVKEFFYPTLSCPVCLDFNKGLCMTCRASFHLFGHVSLLEGSGASLYRHDEKVMALISNYKQKMMFGAKDAMAKLILEEYEDDLSGFDFVTFAPSSRASLKRLGFDHGLLLAEGVATPLRKPVVPLFSPPSREQKILDREERKENARNIKLMAGRLSEIRGKRGIIIDDVYTTGSTMGECMDLMKGEGVSGSYLTFSRI
jgi:competence protein ComFC